MALEIERKFLVASDSWTRLVERRRHLRQAYLSKTDRVSIRVRIDGAEASTLTIKTAEPGIRRHEYEYAIPKRDAEALLLQRDGALITKTRHIVPIGGLIWEIDVFAGENTGLTIAEVELGSPDQMLHRPEWLGREVTHERRYYNSSLAKHPVRLWQPALVS